MTQPIFDGHNDLLSRLWAMKDRHGEAFLEGWEGAVSLPHARAGGWRAGSLPSGFPVTRRPRLTPRPHFARILRSTPTPRIA